MDIDIKKLEKNTKILVETDNAIYEIIVSSQKTGTVVVTGGASFLRPVKVKVQGSKISKLKKMVFFYKEKNEPKEVRTSKVLSARIYGADGSWHFDAIENENSD
tara:strand:+ start:151 stop:462 length:312 start_codon:yes stop_codon:yes gene_type:complete